MIVTSKELKRRARAALSGRYFLASTLTMTLSLVTLGLSFLLDLSGFGESAQPMHQFFFWALWFIMLILGALFEVGLLRVLYACSKKEPSLPRGVLFYAFKNQPDTFILTSAFQYLITLIWFVPALWKYMTFPIPNTYEELLGELIPVLLLALAGLIPAVIASLPFCLTNYVLLDSPYATAREALRGSWQLTKGHRMQILRLWISFLPLCLVGLGSYGFGFLWIKPYYHTTMNQLYLEITGQRPMEENTQENTESADTNPEF